MLIYTRIHKSLDGFLLSRIEVADKKLCPETDAFGLFEQPIEQGEVVGFGTHIVDCLPLYAELFLQDGNELFLMRGDGVFDMPIWEKDGFQIRISESR